MANRHSKRGYLSRKQTEILPSAGHWKQSLPTLRSSLWDLTFWCSLDNEVAYALLDYWQAKVNMLFKEWYWPQGSFFTMRVVSITKRFKSFQLRQFHLPSPGGIPQNVLVIYVFTVAHTVSAVWSMWAWIVIVPFSLDPRCTCDINIPFIMMNQPQGLKKSPGLSILRSTSLGLTKSHF